MFKKKKSFFYFPPIKNKENKENINNLNQTQNKFHFYLRFEKPLKLVEPTNNYFDNKLLLTKLKKRKLIAAKKYAILFKKQNKKYYKNFSSSLYEYKNMIPIKIWDECEQTYNECKQEFNKLRNKKVKNKPIANNNKSMILNNKIGFENKGLNNFIENVEKSYINISYDKSCI